MIDTPKTVFVTKWALSLGIYEFQAEVSDSPRIIVTRPLGDDGGYSLDVFDKPDWHTTREAAVSRANQMRDAKLKSLEAQMDRIRGIAF